MARILTRPMFRKGGSTNEGIMRGLVNRRGYEEGAFGKTARRTQADVYSLLKEMVPPPEAKFPMGQVGLNLVSGQYAGDGLLQNVARSAMDPYAKWTERDDARRNYDRKIKMAAAETGIKQAMTEAGREAKYSNTMRMVEEAIKLGKYPNTLEGRRQAWDALSRSTSDWVNKSYDQRFQEAKDDLIKQGYSGEELDQRADYDARVKPALVAKEGISYTDLGGILPRRKGKPNFSKMIQGKIYFDLKDGVPKKYNGQDPTTNEYLLEPIII